jgi:hypothetical protein
MNRWYPANTHIQSLPLQSCATDHIWIVKTAKGITFPAIRQVDDKKCEVQRRKM